MVDVRSCTRPPRISNQQSISECPRISIHPKSLDQTRTSKWADTSELPRSLRPQFSTSTSIGELCCVVIKWMFYIVSKHCCCHNVSCIIL